MNIVLVHETTNGSKSDVDPGGESQRGRRAAGWWPPDDSQRCWFAHKVIDVKLKWNLAFDEVELEALLGELTGGCCLILTTQKEKTKCLNTETVQR